MFELLLVFLGIIFGIIIGGILGYCFALMDAKLYMEQNDKRGGL